MQSTSFQVVSNGVARREGNGDNYAYGRGETPLICVAEGFFSEPPSEQSPQARPRQSFLDAAQRARLLIHATAHCKLGVGHRGGHFGFESRDCATALALKSFEQAADNACVYDLMAYCAGQQ